MAQADEIIKFLAEEIAAERRLSKLEVGHENNEKEIIAIKKEFSKHVDTLHMRISAGFNRIVWWIIGTGASIILVGIAYILQQL